MKKLISFCAAFTSAAFSYSAPLDDLVASARYLDDASSYTWIVKPDPKVPRPTLVEWRAERGGWIVGRHVAENEPWSVSDGRERFVRDQVGNWKRLDLTPEDGISLRATAAIEVLNEVIGGLKNLRVEGDAIVGELSDEVLTKQLTFGNVVPTNVSGWAKFWIKDGRLQRYQTNRKGTVRDRNNGTRPYDGTIEIQFTNIGSTKVDVPIELKRLFDA